MKIYTVDAFTNEPFSGNPAAVCILNENKDEKWLLNVASEMNLSETAFIKRRNGGYDLRWFTPETEVDLCGHATLASSHILWETGEADAEEEIHFHTRSGLLKASKKGDEITLNFPSIPQNEAAWFSEIGNALNIEKPEYFGTGEHHYFIVLGSEDEVLNVKPDFSLLGKLPLFGTIVTAKAENKDYDFISRFFAPSKGIDEDPVTGSAHCMLAPYWLKIFNKKELKARQASKRNGFLKVSVEDGRVFLTGKAVTVLNGELLI